MSDDRFSGGSFTLLFAFAPADIYVVNKAYFLFYKTCPEPIALDGVIGNDGHQAFGHLSYIAAKR